MEVIKDSLIRMNLSISNLRGQIYNGASKLFGHKLFVAKQIKEEQPKALEIHCRGQH